MHPDIVIMDIIMPGLDGLETAQIFDEETSGCKDHDVKFVV